MNSIESVPLPGVDDLSPGIDDMTKVAIAIRERADVVGVTATAAYQYLHSIFKRITPAINNI